MNNNRKGLLSLFLLACSLATVPAYAEMNKDKNMHKKMGKTHHPVPPAQYPHQEGQRTFFIGAEYTYWVPYQEGINIAVGDNATAVQGDVTRPVMNAQSGFKVFAACNCFHDGWVASVKYTWFYNPTSLRANKLISSSSETPPTYVPTFNVDTISYSAISSKFTNQFNRIEATVARCFFAGHYLSFCPWMGLLAPWESQHLKYEAPITSDPENASDVFNMIQHWWGIGPYAGTKATYYFSKDWGLYIYSGLAMLLSQHDVDNKNFKVNSDMSAEAVTYAVNRFANVEPMFEVGLGLCWEGNWPNWGLKVNLGWELQTYFNHNGFLGYYSPVGINGNYSMQGLTVGAEICF